MDTKKDTGAKTPAPVPGPDDAVSWEFKWENKEDAPIYGPYANDQMIKWANDGYFESGVWVRRVGQPDSQFYTSKRIDFELYS
jgi:CD2 antigen cytoplasmic tail-binding protein 2